MKSKIILILGVILAIIIIFFVGSFIWYSSSLKPVSKIDVNQNQPIRVEITEGMGLSNIADLLKENNIIKNTLAMKIYAKVNKVTNLKAGKYDLNNSENVQTILAHIANGELLQKQQLILKKMYLIF